MSFFSVLMVLSCGVNSGNLGKKSDLPGATSILPIFVGTISKCVRSRYQHTKFRTCMKTAHFLPFAVLLISFVICHKLK